MPANVAESCGTAAESYAAACWANDQPADKLLTMLLILHVLPLNRDSDVREDCWFGYMYIYIYYIYIYM